MGMVKEDNLCNYCRVRAMRQVAEARGTAIKIKPGEMEGVNVYEVPDTGEKYDLVVGTKDHEKYFKEWLPAITDHCVC